LKAKQTQFACYRRSSVGRRWKKLYCVLAYAQKWQRRNALL